MAGNIWRALLAIALCCALLLPGCNAVPTSTLVLELTDKNYEEVVMDKKLNVFVLYYTEWSRICETAQQLWDRVATSQAGKRNRDIVRIAKINGDKYPALMKRERVTSYPTMRYFTVMDKFDEGAYEYTGDREITMVESFIFQNT